MDLIIYNLNTDRLLEVLTSGKKPMVVLTLPNTLRKKDYVKNLK